jgi:hypothetical protein
MIWRGTREGETWLWRIFKKKTNAETADVREDAYERDVFLGVCLAVSRCRREYRLTF